MKTFFRKYRMNIRYLTKPAIVSGMMLIALGCQQKNDVAQSVQDRASSNPTSARPLGWLGATVTPANSVVQVAEAGSSRSSGAVVIQELSPNSPLGAAGAKPNDLIVQVGETWVPVKPNPTLDVVEIFEREISAGKTIVSVKVIRNDETLELNLKVNLPALEVGLPMNVERFQLGARLAAEYLQRDGLTTASQHENSWPVERAIHELVQTANGSTDQSSSREILPPGPEHSNPSVFDLSFALLAMAERLGPLPAEVVVRGPKRMNIGGGGAVMSGGPIGGLPPGAQIHFEATPEMLKQLENDGAVVNIADSRGEAIDSSSIPGLPPGLSVRRISPGDGQLPPGIQAQPIVGRQPTGQMLGNAPCAAPLSTILKEIVPSRLESLSLIEQHVDRLLKHQRSDGALAHSSETEVQAMQSTAWGLVAIAAAERAGAKTDNESINRALSFLRSLTENSQNSPSASDANQSAWRSVHYALPMLAMGCLESDSQLAPLIRQVDQRIGQLAQIEYGVDWNTLALALLQRQRGAKAWQDFYDQARFGLVAAQLPDGSFTGDDSGEQMTNSFHTKTATAIGGLILAMQSDRLPMTTANAINPWAPIVTGTGHRLVLPFKEPESD